MRAIRTTTISILAISLLAGSAVGVTAQDEETDPNRAVDVTGRAAWFSLVSGGTRTSLDGIVKDEDVVHEHIWSASDPRLSGNVTYTGNWSFDPITDIGIQSGTYELTNDEGSWLGNATAYVSDRLGADTDVVVFAGRDAYEGLTAYVVIDWGADDVSGENLKGVIFPRAMPEVPDAYAAE